MNSNALSLYISVDCNDSVFIQQSSTLINPVIILFPHRTLSASIIHSATFLYPQSNTPLPSETVIQSTTFSYPHSTPPSMSSIPQQTTPSPPPPPPVYDEVVNESIFLLPLPPPPSLTPIPTPNPTLPPTPSLTPMPTPNPAPWIQSDLYVQGPSSGVIYSDPPPQHNFWGSDSNGSDVQLSSSGRPIRTRSQSSQSSSSCNSSHPYKIRCPTCSRAYDKYYFKNRKCGCRKFT